MTESNLPEISFSAQPPAESTFKLIDEPCTRGG